MTKTIAERFNVSVTGEGTKQIIFVHGFASNKHTWDWVVPHFIADYQIMTFDFIGSGQSDYTYYSQDKYRVLDGYSNDLIALCEAFDWREVICIGHSVGGLISLLASIKRPDLFKKILMIGASVHYMKDETYDGGFTRQDIDQILEMMEMNYSGWASFLAPVALPESVDAKKTRYVEDNFLKSDPEITYNFLKVTLLMDYRSLLSAVTVPTVILQCSDDSFVPLAVAEFMHNKINDSVLHVLTAKGHYPHVSHPDETIAAIKTYI